MIEDDEFVIDPSFPDRTAAPVINFTHRRFYFVSFFCIYPSQDITDFVDSSVEKTIGIFGYEYYF